MEEFKRDISLWMNYDDSIRQHNSDILSLREKKEQHGIRIMKFLNHKNMTDTKLNLPKYHSTLKMTKQVNSEGITLKFLEESLKEYFGNSYDSEQCFNFIKNRRKKNIKLTLRRDEIKP